MSWRERAVAHGCRRGVRQMQALPLPRRVHRRALGMVAPPASLVRGVAVERKIVAGVPGRIFASDGGARGTLLWLHGGGSVLGSPGGVCGAFGAALARATDRRVPMPDDRPAPEHPFPAAPDDALTVARVLAASGPFVLGSDSAGDALALAMLAALVAEGTPPERTIPASPAVDLDAARPVPDARGEMMLPVAMLRRIARDHAGTTDPRNPRLSPIHARCEGAPPVPIEAAEGEILEGDPDAIEARLRTAGVDVTMRKETGVPHAWQLFAGLAAAKRSLEATASFLATEPAP